MVHRHVWADVMRFTAPTPRFDVPHFLEAASYSLSFTHTPVLACCTASSLFAVLRASYCTGKPSQRFSSSTTGDRRCPSWPTTRPFVATSGCCWRMPWSDAAACRLVQNPLRNTMTPLYLCFLHLYLAVIVVKRMVSLWVCTCLGKACAAAGIKAATTARLPQALRWSRRALPQDLAANCSPEEVDFFKSYDRCLSRCVGGTWPGGGALAAGSTRQPGIAVAAENALLAYIRC